MEIRRKVEDKLYQQSLRLVRNAAIQKLAAAVPERLARSAQASLQGFVNRRLPVVKNSELVVSFGAFDEAALEAAARCLFKHGVVVLEDTRFEACAAAISDTARSMIGPISNFAASEASDSETPEYYLQKRQVLFRGAAAMAAADKPVVDVRVSGVDAGMVDVFQYERLLSSETLQYFEESVRPFVEAVLARVVPAPLLYKRSNLYYSADVVKPRRLHVDVVGPKRWSAKTFLYLSDVSLAHGPYRYVPGSHHTEWEKRVSYLANQLTGTFEQAPTDMQYFNAERALNLTGKAGTFVISLQHGVHGACPQEPGRTRYVFVENYY